MANSELLGKCWAPKWEQLAEKVRGGRGTSYGRIFGRVAFKGKEVLELIMGLEHTIKWVSVKTPGSGVKIRAGISVAF